MAVQTYKFEQEPVHRTTNLLLSLIVYFFIQSQTLFMLLEESSLPVASRYPDRPVEVQRASSLRRVCHLLLPPPQTQAEPRTEPTMCLATATSVLALL